MCQPDDCWKCSTLDQYLPCYDSACWGWWCWRDFNIDQSQSWQSSGEESTEFCWIIFWSERPGQSRANLGICSLQPVVCSHSDCRTWAGSHCAPTQIISLWCERGERREETRWPPESQQAVNGPGRFVWTWAGPGWPVLRLEPGAAGGGGEVFPVVISHYSQPVSLLPRPGPPFSQRLFLSNCRQEFW